MKFILGILVFVLALLLQFWFPIAGVHGDFVLAALIAFAFVPSFWQLVFFILLTVFILNWQPVPDASLLLLALLPLAAFAVYRWLHWEPWIGVAVSVALGIFAFYGVVSTSAVAANISVLAADAIVCIIFGEAVLWGMGN